MSLRETLAYSLVAAFAPHPQEKPPASISFTEEAAARGVVASNHCGDPSSKRWLLEAIGNGAALFDKDGDGDLDLFLVDAGRVVPPPAGDARDVDWLSALDARCVLYENDGSGRFRDATAESGAGIACFGVGVTAADFDGDGDLDLYVTCWGENHLLANDGMGRFTDVTRSAGVGDARWSAGSAFFDADGDGDLDLYVANYFAMAVARDKLCWRKYDCPYLATTAACGPKGMAPEPDAFYLNNGDGTFRDASEESGIHSVEPSFGLGVVAFDADGDGDQDVYVGNDSHRSFLFVNDGHARFTEMADLAGCAVNRNGTSQACMGVACGDYDGDLRQDLFVTTFDHDDKTLFHNEGDGTFLDVTTHHAFGPEAYYSLSWGTEFVDFDHDGDLDLFFANGHVHPSADQLAPEHAYKQQNRVYRNDGGRFVDATASAGSGLARRASHRGAAFGDVDSDGDVDVVVVAQNEPPSLLVNRLSAGAGHWLLLDLRASGKNRFAVGASAIAEAGGRRILRTVRAGGSYVSSSDPRLHFGLGASARIERLRVRWPDGREQTFEDVPADRRLRLVEGGKLEELRSP